MIESMTQDKQDETFDILTVDLGDRSYPICIGDGVIGNMLSHLPFDMKGRKAFILTDENVAASHAVSVYDTLHRGGTASLHILSLPSGEASKSYDCLKQVLDWLLDSGANRDSVLFAVGGGVIGDLGGFAASIVLRGIAYVQVPTTLLAQVDSAVGGKTAIDVVQGKNLVGSFYQPSAVISDMLTLETLPERELKAGYAEIAKYGLIRDASFYEWLQTNGKAICALEDKNALRKAITESCLAKARIVEEDEKEGGVRALLNLGHTFGHALEVCAGYDGRLLHGEAVSVGMCLAFALSHRMRLCTDIELGSVREHLKAVGLPVDIHEIDVSFDVDVVMASMKTDKKMTAAGLKYVLVKGIGDAFVSLDVKEDDVKAVLEQSFHK